MDGMGVGRVWWTNAAGEWEGGRRVRDLVEEALNGGASGDGAGDGVFVTKHEVLRLRRMMGA